MKHVMRGISTLGLVLLIFLILLLVGAFPAWGHGWGYGPSGMVGFVLVVVLILVLLEKI